MSLRAFPHRRLSISAEKETDMHACPIAAGHLAFSQPMLMVVCVRMEEEIHHDGSHVALSSPQKRVSKLISIAPVDHSTMMLKHETTISRDSNDAIRKCVVGVRYATSTLTWENDRVRLLHPLMRQ